jgi:hypothetical protein
MYCCDGEVTNFKNILSRVFKVALALIVSYINRTIDII